MFPNGHFSSPIPDIRDIIKREEAIFGREKPDIIPRNREGEKALLSVLSRYYDDIPFTAKREEGDCRYYYDNDCFSYSDAISLHLMMRHFEPDRIIEVGSGFSSLVMLDTNERFFNGKIKLCFIEPDPIRLLSGLRKRESVELHKKIVQEIDISFFSESLGAGDFLFIDSSHVSKCGSDVNYVIFEVLPALKPGVIIHFHDIFKGWEYPVSWIREGRYWTEIYLLKAFLAHNHDYEILLFNSELDRTAEPLKSMPLYDINHGGSLYVRKK